MGKIISAFEAGNRYGGGVVTGKVIEYFRDVCSDISVRKNVESKFFRILRIILVWIRVPTLHPIFCAYSHRLGLGHNVLNFSQTYNLAVRYPRRSFSLVAHDVVIQRRLFLNCWVRKSEKRAFDLAERIFVISEKDRKLVRRFYKIDDSKIVNLFSFVFPGLVSFHRTIYRDGKFKAMFIGSLKRDENYRGFLWFYENVFKNCSDCVEVSCVGEADAAISGEFKGVVFLDFVDDLDAAMAKCDFTIAPIVDGAGVKIKVVDSLKNKVPVIGTPRAYEGVGRPNPPYCTSNASNWIEIMRSSSICFRYSPPS